MADLNIAKEERRSGWTAYETQYSSKMGEYKQRKKKVEEEIKRALRSIGGEEPSKKGSK